MQKKINNRPGFVRVLIPDRGKTIQIRQNRARDAKYMNKHGLQLLPEPMMPPSQPQPVTPVAAEVEPMKPTKVNTPKTK